jgi:hypothetical protein
MKVNISKTGTGEKCFAPTKKRTWVAIAISLAAMATVFTGCRKDDGGSDSNAPAITITTTYQGAQSLWLAGSGKATINWGDGAAKQTVTLTAMSAGWGGEMDYSPWQTTHTYTGTETKTITITGNITGLMTYGDGGATALDVSKMPALKFLNCSNENLGALDVSKNTALTYLNCSYNQLTKLDVSNNTALVKFYIDNNSITTTYMIALLNSFPTRPATAKGTAKIYTNAGFDYTDAQYKTAKAAAQAKNWTITDN